MRNALGTLILALGTAAVVSAAPPSSDGLSLGGHEDAVTARLLADVVEIAPGHPFQLGIEIRMAEGWHTYWENGGDAGLPTTVEWTLPAGFEAGPIRWPVPHRYEEEGDLVTFGYADRVLLLTDVTPPERLGDEPVRIRGAVDWLQCKDICIPGGAKVEIRLPVEEEARSAHEKILAAFAAARERNRIDAGNRD